MTHVLSDCFNLEPFFIHHCILQMYPVSVFIQTYQAFLCCVRASYLTCYCLFQLAAALQGLMVLPKPYCRRFFISKWLGLNLVVLCMQCMCSYHGIILLHTRIAFFYFECPNHQGKFLSTIICFVLDTFYFLLLSGAWKALVLIKIFRLNNSADV